VKEAEFQLTVNRAEGRVTCEPDTPLLDMLRHDLGLAGRPQFSLHPDDISGRRGTARPAVPSFHAVRCPRRAAR
jgi:hypothetical protein